MKKTIFLLILTICAVTAFSQEAVGKININRPEIKIEMDFYDTNVDMDLIVEVIKNFLVSTKAKGLRSISHEDEEIIEQELINICSNINWSDYEYEYGYGTDYFVTQSSIKYKGKEYFIITVLPENGTWCFEVER